MSATPATPANMRRYAHLPGLFAYGGGQECSANARDYFWLPDDEALLGDDGDPMELVVCVRQIVPVSELFGVTR